MIVNAEIILIDLDFSSYRLSNYLILEIYKANHSPLALGSKASLT